MTLHFNYHPRQRLVDNWSVRSLAPVVSRWLWSGNRTFLEVASMMVSLWIVAFLCCVKHWASDNYLPSLSCPCITRSHALEVGRSLIAEYCRLLNVHEHLSWRFGYVWRSRCLNLASVTSGILILYARIISGKFYFSESKEPRETRVIKLLQKLSILQYLIWRIPCRADCSLEIQYMESETRLQKSIWKKQPKAFVD